MKILSTGSAVPKQSVTNDMMAQVMDTSDEWIYTRTGIRSRFVAGEDENSLTLAVDASKLAISRAGIALEDIGIVICATITGDYRTPSLACLIQRELGLSESVLAFDLNAACSGFIYALAVAQPMLQDGKYALILGSEHLTRVIDFSDRSTCVLFGDGAGAVIAAKSDTAFSFVSGARGESEALAIGAAPSSESPFGKKNKTPLTWLKMDGQAVFRFAVEVMVKSIRDVIEKAGKRVEDISHFVCHQANKRIIDNAVQRLGVPSERFFMNIETHGNTSAASVPLALDELNDTGRLKRGDDVVFAGFGGGLTYGAVYMQW